MELNKKPSYTVPITHPVKQQAHVDIADEAKFCDQSLGEAKQEKKATTLSPLAGLFLEFSYTLSKENKTKSEKKRSFSPSKFSK